MHLGLTRRAASAGIGGTLLTLAAPWANDAFATEPTALGRQLDTYMHRMSLFGFSGQILAALAGELILHDAYGWADRGNRRPMSPSTQIGIASMSKQFTAAALIKLSENGVLSLDEPIGNYLPEAPPDKAALTLHQILSHTAGLPPGDIADDFEVDTKQDMLERVLSAPLASAPGTRWRYSNAGYNVAAAIIERVSGHSYEDYLVRVLFEPAGMPDTGFARHSSLRTHPSHAYRGWLDQGAPNLWPRENFRSWGGGSVFSTAGDIFRWQHALERNRLLSAGSYARLIGFHARPDPDNTNAGYAYGAFVECGDHGLLIERSGDWEGGFNAAWHRWPQEDMTLIILSNSVTPANVSMRQAVQADLEKMMRGEPVEGQPPAARTTSRGRARRLAGAYTAAPNASVDLIGDGPYVWAAARGQTAVELILGDIEPALREQLRTATNKTNTMLANVSREAFATAITAERADLVDEYWAEWESWVGAHGALREFDVLGSARAGRSARTLVRLTFERDEVLAQYFWADLGAGRLAGSGLTNMAPSVTARILAERQEGGWVAYDPMTGAQTLLTIAGTPSPSLRQTVRDSCKEAEPLALV